MAVAVSNGRECTIHRKRTAGQHCRRPWAPTRVLPRHLCAAARSSSATGVAASVHTGCGAAAPLPTPARTARAEGCRLPGAPMSMASTSSAVPACIQQANGWVSPMARGPLLEVKLPARWVWRRAQSPAQPGGRCTHRRPRTTITTRCRSNTSPQRLSVVKSEATARPTCVYTLAASTKKRHMQQRVHGAELATQRPTKQPNEPNNGNIAYRPPSRTPQPLFRARSAIAGDLPYGSFSQSPPPPPPFTPQSSRWCPPSG